jgi:hypothetical protein
MGEEARCLRQLSKSTSRITIAGGVKLIQLNVVYNTAFINPAKADCGMLILRRMTISKTPRTETFFAALC